METSTIGALRVSCLEVDSFSHSTNPEYFSREFDEHTQHDVLRLKNVCWLEMKHTFKLVKRGEYQFVMRMKFGEDFYWPSGDGGEMVHIKSCWRSNKNDANFENAFNFHTNDWEKIRAYINEGTPLEDFPAGCSFKNHDKESGWFDFVVDEPIILEDDNQDVLVRFSDTENNYWKEGMVWDYIELVPFYC
eukprot:TCONS_00060184-protein